MLVCAWICFHELTSLSLRIISNNWDREWLSVAKVTSLKQSLKWMKNWWPKCLSRHKVGITELGLAQFLLSDFSWKKSSSIGSDLLFFFTNFFREDQRKKPRSQKAFVVRDSSWGSKTNQTVSRMERNLKEAVDLGCSALLISYEEGCNDWPDIAASDTQINKGSQWKLVG